MKKVCILFALILTCVVAPTQQSHAVVGILIKAALKKAIKAIDLAIQKQQNKVIWLQNAQKEAENVMSKLKLDEIGDWVAKQKQLYQDYFEELQKVKDVVEYYHRMKGIVQTGSRIVTEYQQASRVLKSSGAFNARELSYMESVYQGMLQESTKTAAELNAVVQSWLTSMTDAERLQIIDNVATRMDRILNDLKAFNTENKLLGLQRQHEDHDTKLVQLLNDVP